METLYGKYPKHLLCQCNAEEMSEEVVTISLNDRCPICGETRRICIPKRDIKVKEELHIGSYSQVA
jgi:hypothetical protein